MEQSSHENNRKDDCDDAENENEEATTSKAEFNDPNQTALNINDLKIFKALHFNSADDVRQAMKAIMSSNLPHDNSETNKLFVPKSYKDAETNVNNDFDTVTDKDKIENNGEDKKEELRGTSRTNPIRTKQKESKRVRKRPAKPLKSKPTKRYKGANLHGFYWGKISNFIFLKQRCSSHSSSDSDSNLSV